MHSPIFSKTETTSRKPGTRWLVRTAFVLVRVAEAEGFEPPVPLGTLAFKASALDRSATLPECTLVGAGAGLFGCLGTGATQVRCRVTRCSATSDSSLRRTQPRQTR